MTFTHKCREEDFQCFQIDDTALTLSYIEDHSFDAFESKCLVKFCPFCGYCPENEKEDIKGTWDKKYYLFQFCLIRGVWLDMGEVRTKMEAKKFYSDNPNYRKYIEWDKVPKQK